MTVWMDFLRGGFFIIEQNFGIVPSVPPPAINFFRVEWAHRFIIPKELPLQPCMAQLATL